MAPWPAGSKGWCFLWFWGEVGSGGMESPKAISDTESRSWVEHNKRPEHYRVCYNFLQLGRHHPNSVWYHGALCIYLFNLIF